MSRGSYEEQLAKREAKRKELLDIRDASKRKWESEAKQLITQIRRIVPACGLTLGQLSVFSGVVKSGISRLMKGLNHSAHFSTIVQLLGAAGYRFEIVPIDPHKDEYREHRRLKPPPLED
jgi:hypothetical protein